jgi:DNA repair exonuclease SbcCD ATPase subunit
MRLLSIEVKNYRIHRDVKVDLDPSRNVITGPNESGKSTLVQAAHRALFMKSKITGDALKGMKSDRHPGNPEVKLTFEVGSVTYTVTKRFSGTTGTTTLSEAGGATLHGDEAEERLNGILGVGASEGGRGAEERVNKQWAHLWAWQGSAASDPADHANDQFDSLLSRLQRSGGAVVMQSELDAQVATTVQQEFDAEFTENGKARKNSELDLANDAANQAAAQLASAREQMQQLLDAAQKFEDAQRTIQTETVSLAQLGPQLELVKSKLTRVNDLRGTEKLQQIDAADKERQLRELAEADQKIEHARAEVKKRSLELAPMEAKVGELKESEAALRVEQSRAELAQQDASAKARIVRLRTAALDGFVTYFETVAQRDLLTARFERVTKSRKERDELQAALAKLPAISPQKLKALEKLQKSVDDAAIALNAMGAGIQVIASDVDVRAGDMMLEKGKPHLVTEDTEVLVGKGVRLRITPGGGVSLATARATVNDARLALQKALDEAGIESTSEAVEIVNQRKQIDAQIKSVDVRLEESAADSIDAELARLEEAVVAARADLDRRCAAVDGLTAPKDASTAKTMRKAIEPEWEAVEENEQKCSHARDAAAKRLTKKSDELRDQSQLVHDGQRALDLLRGHEHQLVETHGPDEKRHVELARRRESNSSAQTELQRTRSMLGELQPEMLASDLTRLERSIKRAHESKAAANDAFLVAQTKLFRDGTSDPRSELLVAEAAERNANARLVPAKRRAESVRLLNDLFTDAQRALAEQFTKPLADKISVYLQCLFGARGRVDLSIEENTFGDFSLVRDDADGGTCSFDALSGGTKEQVAAAVRLGIAEVLAEGHEGCLPVVLDEAFAYSDPERIQALQRMLDLAAHRGLQLIVLTNNLTDFAGLGAQQVVLRVDATTRREPANGVATSIDARSADRADIDTDAAIDPPVSEADCQEFIEALTSEGGSSGNISLRKKLGWDEPRYRVAKERLVDDGAVTLGAGRGGTVTLRAANEEG